MRQVILVAFCIVWMFHYATSTVVEDDNTIIELAFQTYYKAINMSGRYNFVTAYCTEVMPGCFVAVGTLAGCRPIIYLGPNGSKIRSVDGWRAQVALIVKPGKCEINDSFT